MERYRHDLRLRLVVALGIRPQQYHLVDAELDGILRRLAVNNLKTSEFRDWAYLFYCSDAKETAEYVFEHAGADVEPNEVLRNANRASKKLVDLVLEEPTEVREWKAKWKRKLSSRTAS